MVGQGPVDQLPYGKGGQIDGKGELNLRRRDVEACGNRRQRGLVHGERERAERNERGDQPLSPRARGERGRFDLPTRRAHRRRSGWPFRLESGATYCAASGGRSSITLIDATTKPASLRWRRAVSRSQYATKFASCDRSRVRRQVARHLMAGRGGAQEWLLRPANRHDVWASCVKVAACWWIECARDLARNT